MANKTVREIVKAYLVENGFDGLAGDECGCRLNDFMPCDHPDLFYCVAGYKCKFTECEQDMCVRSTAPDKQTDCMKEES